jgi:hypothetical protein
MRSDVVLRMRFNGIFGFNSYIFNEYDAIQSNIYKDKKLKLENGDREECKLYKIKWFFKLSFAEISLFHIF